MSEQVTITLKSGKFELAGIVHDATPANLEDALDELRFKMTVLKKAMRKTSEPTVPKYRLLSRDRFSIPEP